jgi:hypothetical protein
MESRVMTNAAAWSIRALRIFAEPYSGAAAVLIDEFDAAGFQCSYSEGARASIQ